MARRSPAVLGLLCLACVASCFEPRFVRLASLDQKLESSPRLPWKARLSEFARRYDASPTLERSDERFGPIFGGLSTLTYFGFDLQQKLLDQRIPKDWRREGSDLWSACQAGTTAAPPAGSATDLASPSEPDAQSLWLALPIAAEPLAADARCDPLGHPLGGQGRHFCMFGRLALQRDAPRPLVLVVHGMFDSSAQLYMRRIAATLFAQGYSTLLLDMRDHGDTFRAGPSVPTTLGTLEDNDLLAVARALHTTCGARVSRVGAVGVSAGGLDVVTAYANDARDGHVWLDGGAVALSPLLDVAATLARLEHPRACSTLNAVELTWVEHLALAGVGAATFFGGAALIETLEHERLDSRTAIAAGVGAASGLALGLLADALIDGDSATSEGCIGQSSIGALFQEILQQRWATLLALDEGGLRSSRPSAETVTFSDYLSLRVDRYYRQRGMNVARLTPQRLSLALEARAARAPGDGARLLLLGADDDPVTLAPALHELARRTASLSRVHVVPVAHGGHGAFWIVQPALTQQLFGMFFAASPE